MTSHPIAWPDIIIGVLIAEGFLYSLRTILHYIDRRNHNSIAVRRLKEIHNHQAAALDSYRIRQNRGASAPLG